MGLEGMKSIIRKRAKAANTNIHSEAHYWADVISREFHERKRFGMYLGIIKRIGVKAAQNIFQEIKESRAKSPGKLFVWKTSAKNVISKNKPKI